jgi:hypothetical protein
MQLDLDDKETLALLNLLVETIEGDRQPFSPRIRLLRPRARPRLRRSAIRVNARNRLAKPVAAAPRAEPSTELAGSAYPTDSHLPHRASESSLYAGACDAG